MRKTFNIGECCLHGTIVAEATEKKFKIKVCEYRKPKEVKIFTEFDRDSLTGKQECMAFLESITTYYYAEKVIEHFEEKLKVKAISSMKQEFVELNKN